MDLLILNITKCKLSDIYNNSLTVDLSKRVEMDDH